MFAVGCSLCKLRPEGQEFTPTHIVGRLCETPVQEDRPAERLPTISFHRALQAKRVACPVTNGALDLASSQLQKTALQIERAFE